MEYLAGDRLKIYFKDGSEVVVSVLEKEDRNYKCSALSKNEVYSEGDIVYVDPSEDKIEKLNLKKKSTGEPDQDYDIEIYDEICNALKENGIDASHREFDKYQGVYINTSKGTLWTIDSYFTGSSSEGIISSTLIDEEGNESSGNIGDYFTLPDDYVFEGQTLEIVEMVNGERKYRTIDNPKKSDLGDSIGGSEFSAESQILTLWKEGSDEENVAEYVEGSGDVSDIMRLLNEKTAIKKKSSEYTGLSFSKVIREEMGVKSFKDKRKKVNRLVCEFVDSDNNEYRKSFEFPLNYSYDKMVNSFQDKINKKSGIYEDDDPYGQEDAFNFSHPGKTYEFVVNLDERGSFYADVRDPDTDESIYEIDTEKIQQLCEDGYMLHNQDYEGLESYLKQLDIIEDDDGIILRRGVKKKSKRFNWEFDKHQPQYKLNPVTGEIEKDEEAVTKVGKIKKKGEQGKFEGISDEYLYFVKELYDEQPDEEIGSVTESGIWYGLYKEEKSILSEDSQGFVDFDIFDNEKELMNFWSKIVKEEEKYYSDEDDELLSYEEYETDI